MITTWPRLRTAVLTLALGATGCQSQSRLQDPAEFTSNFCHLHYRDGEAKDTDEQLDQITTLFRAGCYREVITRGDFVRHQRRDKLYSVSSEMAELLTPEGTFSPYTLESFERSFLSILMAISYVDLERDEDARVELRRTTDEENAQLYNYGEDPVIALLLAVLWDRYDPTSARPHWQRLAEMSVGNPELSQFAKARVHEIDQAPQRPLKWRVTGQGILPMMEWHAQFFRANPYLIEAKERFPVSCASRDSLRLPTATWTHKIGSKYRSDYHPLLMAKSLARLPFGIVYGIVGVSTGTAVGIGGCAAAVKAGDGAQPLCSASLMAAKYLIEQSADLTEYTLSPDMRHWKDLPAAIVISRATGPGELRTDCANQDDSGQAQMRLLD